MGDERMSGERYLRLLFERVLDPLAAGVSDEHALRQAGHALTSVGAVAPALVDELTYNLALALALRRENRHVPDPSDPAWSRSVPAAWTPTATRRVILGPVRRDSATGTLVLTDITFGPEGSVAHLRGDWDPGGGSIPSTGPVAAAPSRAGGAKARPPGRPRRPASGGPPAPPMTTPGGSRPTWRAERGRGSDRPQLSAGALFTIRDDRGTTYRLGPRIAGRGGDDQPWTAHHQVVPDLPDDVAWVEVTPAGGPPVRLTAEPPRQTLTARHHGRAPGQCWVLGQMWSAVASPGSRGPGAILDGIAALAAIGALDPADPLIHHATLLEAGRDAASDPALDARWRSPLQRIDATSERDGIWPIGVLVDFGDTAARFDLLDIGDFGAEVRGACNRSDDHAQPLVISAFDDRHNWYPVTRNEPTRHALGGDRATWRVSPAIDPMAISLRFNLMSPEREASLEVSLG